MTIIKRHETEDGWREAVYSECETYRYTLRINWQEHGRRLLYIMLNPSKATELANDPTIERCERRARQLGYGNLEVVNLFGLRETHPEKLKKARRPEGSENLDFILSAAESADDILAAWGVHGSHRNQGNFILSALQKNGHPVLCLGQTKEALPRHPLYVSYKTKPPPFP